jgi:DNA-binding transcriptional regulator YiaG
MKFKDIIRIRESLDFDRHEFAKVLGLSGYRSLMNVELGRRRPNKLAIRLLCYLDALPKSKALAFIEEFTKWDEK